MHPSYWGQISREPRNGPHLDDNLHLLWDSNGLSQKTNLRPLKRKVSIYTKRTFPIGSPCFKYQGTFYVQRHQKLDRSSNYGAPAQKLVNSGNWGQQCKHLSFHQSFRSWNNSEGHCARTPSANLLPFRKTGTKEFSVSPPVTTRLMEIWDLNTGLRELRAVVSQWLMCGEPRDQSTCNWAQEHGDPEEGLC